MEQEIKSFDKNKINININKKEDDSKALKLKIELECSEKFAENVLNNFSALLQTDKIKSLLSERPDNQQVVKIQNQKTSYSPRPPVIDYDKKNKDIVSGRNNMVFISFILVMVIFSVTSVFFINNTHRNKHYRK